VAHEAARIQETCLDVLALEPGIASQEGLDGVPGGEHPEDVLDRQASAAD
jgi:hypothetical protein